MFAGFATGGIPASGSDRSAIGPATCQVTAALDGEGPGETRPALARGALDDAGSAECDVGRKIITLAAITATTATDTAPNHTRRLARRPDRQPTLPMPILPPRPSQAMLVPSQCLRTLRSTPGRRPAPRFGR